MRPLQWGIAVIGLLLSLLLFAAQANLPVKHFHKVAKALFPRTVLEDLCGDSESENDCFASFQKIGEVWAGDVNDDGVDELLVFPGRDWVGSGGEWYILYQQQGGKWRPLYPNQDGFGWQVMDPRFDILPVSHDGYHDLRVATDWCLKWNGKNYVDYEDSDYHQLSPEFFNRSAWWEAGIFWDIHYAGLKNIRFEPQFFPVPSDFSTKGRVKVEDHEQGVVWMALFKGDVWRVDGSRAFLLLPRPGYLGSEQMELGGDWRDWLVVHGETVGSAPPPVVARYNRRTHNLRIVEQTSER